MSNLHFLIRHLNLSKPLLPLLWCAVLTKPFSLKMIELLFPQLLSIRILFNPIKKCTESMEKTIFGDSKSVHFKTI